MPTTQVPARLTVDDLTAAAKQLSPAELRDFTRRLSQWQRRNGAPDEEEAALIEATKERLPPPDERRLKRLSTKSERGTLTPKELPEYRRLARQAEQLDVKRVTALAELARRRGQPVRAVMQSIGWECGEDETPSSGARRAQAGARARRGSL